MGKDLIMNSDMKVIQNFLKALTDSDREGALIVNIFGQVGIDASERSESIKALPEPSDELSTDLIFSILEKLPEPRWINFMRIIIETLREQFNTDGEAADYLNLSTSVFSKYATGCGLGKWKRCSTAKLMASSYTPT